MNSKKTRSIISILISVILTFSFAAASVSVLLEVSLANSAFINRFFITDRVVSECEKQLDLQFDALAVKSGIPSRVFKNIKSQNPVQETVRHSVDYLYSGENENLNSENKKDYFYRLCTEYLNGNNIAYNEADVMAAAEEAAEIYIGVCTLQNTNQIAKAVGDVKNIAPKITLGSLLAVIACCAVIFMLYSSRKNAFSYVASGVSGSGFSLVLIAVISLIFSFGKNFMLIAPDIYENAFSGMIKIFFVFMLLLGVAESVAGTAFVYLLTKSRNKSV